MGWACVCGKANKRIVKRAGSLFLWLILLVALLPSKHIQETYWFDSFESQEVEPILDLHSQPLPSLLVISWISSNFYILNTQVSSCRLALHLAIAS